MYAHSIEVVYLIDDLINKSYQKIRAKFLCGDMVVIIKIIKMAS